MLELVFFLIKIFFSVFFTLANRWIELIKTKIFFVIFLLLLNIGIQINRSKHVKNAIKIFFIIDLISEIWEIKQVLSGFLLFVEERVVIRVKVSVGFLSSALRSAIHCYWKMRLREVRIRRVFWEGKRLLSRNSKMINLWRSQIF